MRGTSSPGHIHYKPLLAKSLDKMASSPLGEDTYAGSAASGSSSALKDNKQLLLPETPRQAGEEEKTQTFYTTAGTIWKPESEKPLKAPVRRGRVNRYSPLDSGNRVSLLTRQLDMMGIDNHGYTRNPYLVERMHTPMYSPLQQNNERARSPAQASSHNDNRSSAGSKHMGSTLGVMRSTTELANVTMSPSVISNANRFYRGLPLSESDDVFDSVDEALRRLPVKSLANLASYPNPNQEKARRALTKAYMAMGKLFLCLDFMMSNVDTVPPKLGTNVHVLV